MGGGSYADEGSGSLASILVVQLVHTNKLIFTFGRVTRIICKSAISCYFVSLFWLKLVGCSLVMAWMRGQWHLKWWPVMAAAPIWADTRTRADQPPDRLLSIVSKDIIHAAVRQLPMQRWYSPPSTSGALWNNNNKENGRKIGTTTRLVLLLARSSPHSEWCVYVARDTPPPHRVP